MFMNLKTRIQDFIKEAPDSIRGYLNVRELFRIVLVAIATGKGTEMLFADVHDSLGTILVDPGDMAWVSAMIVSIVEIRRRLNHGSDAVAHVPASQVTQSPQ